MSENKTQNLKYKSSNSKSEYLNSKQILISQFSKSQIYRFGTLEFRIWDLFRISDFGFRIFRFALPFFILVFSMWIFSYAQEQFVYDSKNKRDPFIPLVTPDGRLLKLDSEEEATGLLLEGIIYDKYGLSYAIVNGEVIKVGDKLGDYQVFKIEKDKVIFLKEGRPLEIELKKEEP